MLLFLARNCMLNDMLSALAIAPANFFIRRMVSTRLTTGRNCMVASPSERHKFYVLRYRIGFFSPSCATASISISLAYCNSLTTGCLLLTLAASLGTCGLVGVRAHIHRRAHDSIARAHHETERNPLLPRRPRVGVVRSSRSSAAGQCQAVEHGRNCGGCFGTVDALGLRAKDVNPAPSRARSGLFGI